MREADIHLPDEAFEAMGVGDFVDCLRAAGIRDAAQITCEGPGGVGVFTLAEPVDGELDDIDAVEWWERLPDSDDGVTYLCKMVAPDVPAETPPMHDLGLAQEDTTFDDAGVTLTLVGSQDGLGRNLENLEAAGATAQLRRIADYGGPNDALDALTDRQREVLATARDLGYFEVPREATVEDVADRLDLDPSTVAEHLQRAERNLVTSVLG